MPGLDLRGQNRLLKRVFILIPPLVLALIHLFWNPAAPEGGPPAQVGGAFFLFLVGGAVVAIFAGLAVPRLWIRLGDRDRELMTTGATIANVIGWSWLASTVFCA